jgi:hypothetical protein
VLVTGRVAAVSIAATWPAGADPTGRRAARLADLTA